MRKLQKIKQYVREQKYRIAAHAQGEAAKEALTKNDIEYAILKGEITKKLTHDPRGTRYMITGPALDGRIILVVCRFLEVEKLSIITIYLKEGEGDAREMRLL